MQVGAHVHLRILNDLIVSGSDESGIMIGEDGASIDVGKNISVGEGADDESHLALKNGGKLNQATDSLLILGSAEGSFGNLLITEKSRADVGRVVNGSSGQGYINVEVGGVLNSQGVIMGDAVSATGDVHIHNDGSVWNINGDLTVGNAGEASLSIFDGSMVKVSGDIDVATAVGSLGRIVVGSYYNDDNDSRLEAALAPGKLDASAIRFGYGKGSLTFYHTDQNYIFNTKLISSVNGKGIISQRFGTTILTADNSQFSGDVVITGGTLRQGAVKSFSPSANHLVFEGGTLDLGGFDTTLLTLFSMGTVDFGEVETPGQTLTIANDYEGYKGTFIINTVLGDDNSKTDKIVFEQDTDGEVYLKVRNHGGVGAQTNNGIKVAESNGLTSLDLLLHEDYKASDGKRVIVVGAFAYSLEKEVRSGIGADWYLRSDIIPAICPPSPTVCPSTPRYSASVPVYEGYIQTMQALNKLPSLQQRVSNRYWSNAANPVIEQGADMAGTPLVPAAEAGAVVNGQAIWGRIEGAYSRFDANHSTVSMRQDISTLIVRAGIDGQFYEGETGRLIAGITGLYGKARGDVASDYGDGQIDTQGWGLGGTLTWYGDAGFYTDIQGQVMWYGSDLTSATAKHSLVKGNNGSGYGLSAEAGNKVDLDNEWSLTPQAQLTWSSVTFDTFNDAWGAAVVSRSGDSLSARLGLSVDYRYAWRGTSGQLSRSTVYAIANLYQELIGGSGKVKVAGVDFDTGSDRTWGGLGAGGTLTWADDKYAFYGEGSVNTSLRAFAESYAVKGAVGLKVKW